MRWLHRSSRPLTDFELLKAIYRRHRAEFSAQQHDETMRAKGFLPIAIPEVAHELGVDAESVFGRLYYHLDPLYAPLQQRGQPQKHLFAPSLGDRENCINFPFLQAVLAGLWLQRRRDLRTFWIAVVSLGVAAGSLVVSLACFNFRQIPA